jgi:hypothetical protein
MGASPAVRVLRVTLALGVAALVGATATMQASGAGGRVSGETAAVPASLDEIESEAEDLVDAALAHDRSAVRKGATALRRETRGAAVATLRDAGVPTTRVRALQSRAHSVASVAPSASFVSVALAANAVSGLMPELYARFAGAAVAGVLRLDYLDREAQLRSLAGQRSRVAPAVADLDAAWKAVRPRIRAKGGTHEAAAFDAHVAAMHRLVTGSPTSLQREAVKGLALVDELEQVLAR